MSKKTEKKRKDENKAPNGKNLSQTNMDSDPDMSKPVRGLPRV